MTPAPVITRFAPSPTGRLHLGHVYAALFARDQAAIAGGRFILRIEDIDRGRCRAAFEDAILHDLAWLGLDWAAPVMRQSERLDVYRRSLDHLAEGGLLYPCFCARRHIREEIDRAGVAPHLRSGPDGPLYPGTCRTLDRQERAARIDAGVAYALRLDTAKAVAQAGPLTWRDRRAGTQTATPEIFGDVVLARKDVATSYHLAVTVDDAAQGISLVTRAEDLFPATHIHRLLQALLDLPVPTWHHHQMLTDTAGKRFAKRDRAVTIAQLRAQSRSPAEVRTMAQPRQA